MLYEPQATLNSNKTLTVKFELKNCQRYWTAVWIQIWAQKELTSGDEQKGNRTVLQIPKECLQKRGNLFWLALPLNAKACSFPLVELLGCKVYTVDITPIYFTLQGRSSSVQFTVPPEVVLIFTHSYYSLKNIFLNLYKLTGNSTNLVSLQRVPLQNSTHMFSLTWSVFSEECALLLNSINLRIYEDESNTALQSYIVPTDCLGNGKQNYFTTELFSTEYSGTCSNVNWKPLDVCRKYMLEVEPDYYSAIKGKLSYLEIFTPSTGTWKPNSIHSSTFSNKII